MSQTALPRLADAILSSVPEHAEAAGTLCVGELPLPPAGASAADPVIVAASAGQSQLLSSAAQLLKFGTVGGLGLLWDVSTVYALQPLVGIKGAALVAFFVAATMNWMLNRLWTFRGRGSDTPLVRQWLGFLGANGFGFVLNRSTFFVLISFVPFCRMHLVTALAAGSLAGMCANFNLSRRLVFR